MKNTVQAIFCSSFKSLLDSLILQCPKEILVEILSFINREYVGLKDQLLSYYGENFTSKEKEKIWEQVTSEYMDFLHPLIETVEHFQRSRLNENQQNSVINEAEMKNNKARITTSNTLNQAIMSYRQKNGKKQDSQRGSGTDSFQEFHGGLSDAYNTFLVPEKCSSLMNQNIEQCSSCNRRSPPTTSGLTSSMDNHLNENEIQWPNPFQINYIRLRDPNDVATIKCKIKSLTIPYAIVDSGSNISIITENIAKKLGLEIDKNNVSEISVIKNMAKTVGVCYDLPVSLEQGNKFMEVTDDFAVIKEESNEPFVLLGTPWLYRAGWHPIVNGEFEININGEKMTIPLSVHKAQREIFTAENKIKKKLNCNSTGFPIANSKKNELCKVSHQSCDSCEHSLRVKKLEEQLEKALDYSLIFLNEYTILKQKYSKEQSEMPKGVCSEK
jgi:hypothetical protein